MATSTIREFKFHPKIIETGIDLLNCGLQVRWRGIVSVTDSSIGIVSDSE